MKKPFLIFCALFGVFFALLNTAGSYFGWYSFFWWFDILMHGLGGVWIGLVLPAFTPHLRHTLLIREYRFYIQLGVMALPIVIGWEIFEYSVGAIVRIHNLLASPIDSISDILLGLGGTILAGIFFVYYYKTHEQE